MLNDEAIDAVVQGRFSLDLVRATLRPKLPTGGYTYAGPCSVSHDGSGKLRLKLYHAFIDKADTMDEWKANQRARQNLVLGQVVDEAAYYVFHGTDLSGQDWTCERVSVSPDYWMPAEGRVVEVDLDHLTTESEWPADYAPLPRRSTCIIPGSFSLPDMPRNWDHLSRAFSVCKFSIEEACNCELRTPRDRLEVHLSKFGEGTNDRLDKAVIEAVGVSVGAFLSPVYRYQERHRTRTTTIYSRVIDSARILPPVPQSNPDEDQCIPRFVSAMVKRHPEPGSHIARSCRRVIDGMRAAILENRASILTIAIEGFVKHYFKARMAPDVEYLDALEKARGPLSTLDIPDRAKRTLEASLNNANRPSPSNALYALVRENQISEHLVESWRKLRNMSTHAGAVDPTPTERQKGIDQQNSTLELFYRLMTMATGYDGPLIQYSVHGFPSSGGRVPRPKVAEAPGLYPTSRVIKVRWKPRRSPARPPSSSRTGHPARLHPC